ncbi:MAG: endonuclease/exonuclease/phosphatase family protein [Gammaproteobacteria bacterium]|uniref:endonuclease/exonuclease/phosphatase family protein n=1 Tax=Rhodoferax sp. TaxID=50421 RepID=UPI0018150299|nr:endonuclease/exonuclease/phosphatase family protein [Rhodoferax sp.]MBU3900612.1 endonuclease/exonuclease/phosphatase family protein [Gammaproteobacteria bacterium]MBA3059093.1 EEP domain-containing protein [Rhodoferax sp.]MBU3996725.1 endonuclease/exonuclease/phosphatase family protein [Gammaproteobacteria bacterium]MBU4081012.1 endonuclease/exonuclease/phosphatase family protein [Gammaproteobacteria bacterium]MBU4113176.1 endonuclease/exonuclease/phosphatase family protein [Gammaproteobac
MPLPKVPVKASKAALAAASARLEAKARAAAQEVLAAAPPGLSIKVLTVNIHKGFTVFNSKFILHELRDAVRLVGADVVFLQEVTGSHARNERRVTDYPSNPHYEFMADSIWPQFAYGRNAVYPGGHHGNAVLSKFPIVSFKNHDVSIMGPERRGLLHCVLQVPGLDSQVHAICVHLGLAESHRLKQMHMLCDLVHRDIDPGDPVIVAGDFNDWRARAHTVLATGADLQEVYVQAYGRAARTFPARLPVLMLDRIYVRNAVAHAPLVLPLKPWSKLSDHAPLAATIKL